MNDKEREPITAEQVARLAFTNYVSILLERQTVFLLLGFLWLKSLDDYELWSPRFVVGCVVVAALFFVAAKAWWDWRKVKVKA